MKTREKKINCKSCNKLFKNKRGIATHVFRHSAECLKTYINLYGFNRWNWSEDTFLNFKRCNDCGEPLKDIRSKEFCSVCRQNKHNVMKNLDVIKKNVETNKPIKNSDKYKKQVSERSIKMYKENPHLKEKQREYMLNGGSLKARKGIKNPSKPQVKLFDMVKELFPESLISYDITGIYNSKKFQFEVDIVIPNRKIVIEYDEPYWHKNKEFDSIRQKKIESLGWKFLRYERVPDFKDLRLDIGDICRKQ